MIGQRLMAGLISIFMLFVGWLGAEESQSTTTEQPKPTLESELRKKGLAEEKQDPNAPGIYTITVTATRVESKTMDTPSPVTVLDEEQVHRHGSKNFLDALTQVPGVRIGSRQENGLFGGDIQIRGLDTNSTSGGNALILLDGIPQRRLSFGGPYMGAMPYEAIDRMEVVKGAMGAQYGRGALAGAVQLFTKQGTEIFEEEFDSTYEAVTNSGTFSLCATGPIKPLKGATFSMTSSGYIAEGWQERTNAAHKNFYLRLDFPITEYDHLRFIGGVCDSEEENSAPVLIAKNGKRLFGMDRDDNLAVPDQNSIELTELRTGIVYTHDFAKDLRMRLTQSYWDGETNWVVGRPSDAPASGTFVARPSNNRDFIEESYFSELQLEKEYAFGSDIRGTVSCGGSFEWFMWDNYYQDVYIAPGLYPLLFGRPAPSLSTAISNGIPIDMVTMAEIPESAWSYSSWGHRETKEIDYSGFLSNQIGFYDRFDLQMGLRYDYYRRRQKNFTNDQRAVASDWALSPTLGGTFHLFNRKPDGFDLRLYSNWGKGFNPVFRAVANAEIVQIEPETSENLEAGLKSAAFGDRLTGELSFYRLDRQDVVNYNVTSRMYENAGTWRIEGMEVQLAGKPVNDLTITASYTARDPIVLVNETNRSLEGKLIPGVARQMLTVGAHYLHPKLHLGFDVEARHNGDARADEANNVHLPSWWVVDAGVSYRWKNLEASAFAKNLLDQDYYSGTFSGIKNGSAFEATPRTFGLSLKVRF